MKATAAKELFFHISHIPAMNGIRPPALIADQSERHPLWDPHTSAEAMPLLQLKFRSCTTAAEAALLLQKLQQQPTSAFNPAEAARS